MELAWNGTIKLQFQWNWSLECKPTFKREFGIGNLTNSCKLRNTGYEILGQRAGRDSTATAARFSRRYSLSSIQLQVSVKNGNCAVAQAVLYSNRTALVSLRPFCTRSNPLGTRFTPLGTRFAPLGTRFITLG